MKIIDENQKELDAKVSIGSDNGLLGLFLEARGGKLGEGARNPDYFMALELILKRLYKLNVKEIRVFRSSLRLPFSEWNIDDREIFINDSQKIKLSNEYKILRQKICTSISKFKENPQKKGGNPTKRIFITADIEPEQWDSILRNNLNHEANNFTISDEQEQEEIAIMITKEKKSKELILKELINLTSYETNESKIQFKCEGYKRNNQAIARIKLLRDFKCQICGTSIKKKNGLQYIEAAHIDPKRLKGKETLDNIILLCPNHHKEFDLGELEYLHRNNESIKIKLNGSIYLLNLLY